MRGEVPGPEIPALGKSCGQRPVRNFGPGGISCRGFVILNFRARCFLTLGYPADPGFGRPYFGGDSRSWVGVHLTCGRPRVSEAVVQRKPR